MPDSKSITTTDAREKTIQHFVDKGMEKAIINTIWDSHAKDLTPAEFVYFQETALNIGANILKKEIFAVKYTNYQTKKASVTLIMADAFLDRLAKQDPRFDSVASGVVREKQVFKKKTHFDPQTGFNIPVVEHEESPETLKNSILGAWAIGYRKDACPIYFFASWEAYSANKDTWKKYADAMILKCAESRVKKRLFVGEMGDVYTEAEMDSVIQSQKTHPPKSSIRNIVYEKTKEEIFSEMEAIKTEKELTEYGEKLKELFPQFNEDEKDEIRTKFIECFASFKEPSKK